MRNFISDIDLGSVQVLNQEREASQDAARHGRVFDYPLDTMNKADGLELLRSTPDNYTKLVIFDPQYRQVLDKLKFGNEGKRQKGVRSCRSNPTKRFTSLVRRLCAS